MRTYFSSFSSWLASIPRWNTTLMISILVTIPFTFAGTIIAMIPASFFGYLKSWMISFANGAGLVLTFIGIKEIEKDDNNMPLVYGLAALASAVLSTILGLLFK